MEHARSWPDHAALTATMDRWRQDYANREVFRVIARPGWVQLHLAGTSRDSLLLCDLPGARLVCHHQGPLPTALSAAMPGARKHPLYELLRQARLVDCGILPNDRVVALHLTRPDASDVVLLHRLFGARANTTLIDEKQQLLWSIHRPPHPALASWPPPDTWASGPAKGALDINDEALTRLAQSCHRLEFTRNTTALNRHRKTNARLLGNLHRDLANANLGDEHRRKAEALAANLYQQDRGAAEIELNDLTTGLPLTISLDPARTPAQNMEAWFRRARKADKGLEIIRDRRREAAATAERLSAAAQDLQTAAASGTVLAQLAALQSWRTEYSELFPNPRQRPGTRVTTEPARPFRRYLIDDTWEVWVGRSSKENDSLTHRAAHHRDLWFHAQGVPGSHVILRTAGHPERISQQTIEKVAALAALHSKARHAQIVPVIYTEKRYVRKPRKSPPGTAACLRDKSLFVEPGLKPGVVPA